MFRSNYLIIIIFDFNHRIELFPVRSLRFLCRKFNVPVTRNLQRSIHGTNSYRIANDVQHATWTRARIWHVVVLLDGRHPTIDGRNWTR